MANQTNDLIILSDAHEKIRQIVGGEALTILMSERKYMEAAKRMAEISRLAQQCGGIYFDLHIKAGAPIVSTVTEKNHLSSLEEAEQVKDIPQ